MKRLIAAIVIAATLFSSASVALATPEDNLAQWVNTYRHRHAETFLNRPWPLDRIAEHHSREMAMNYRLRAMTDENNVVGVAYPGHLRRIFERWRDNPSTRRILRGNYDRFGVGVYRYYGRIWVTVVFR